MAILTDLRSSGITIGMAFETGSVYMASCKRETGVTMIECPSCRPIRMTMQTGFTVVGIASHIIMFTICFTFAMAAGTGEHCIIGRIGVTIGAGIPLSFMLSAIDREIGSVMIKCGRLPSVNRMTGCTIGSKSHSGMIWSTCSGIIVAVAAETVGRELVVGLSLMTGKACDIIMSSGERKETVVKSVTTPFKRLHVMTTVAIG
jgi:hypothetical protein